MENDKLVRLSDVKALFHRGDERTFPFSFPGLVTERDVDSIPAVDAVEVVRCKDCKWFACEKGELQETYKVTGCYRLKELGKNEPLLTSSNGFCSWGLRREEEHNAVD